MRRTSIVLIGGMLWLSAATAAQAPDGVTKVVQGGFTDVSGYVLKAAEMVPAERYTYQPTKDVRTFGQMVAHIVDGYNYFCAAGSGTKIQWSDAAEKGATDKATLTGKLKQATTACQATYAGKAQLGELIKNNEHTNLHYGNLVTYLRMMGMKPPSS